MIIKTRITWIPDAIISVIKRAWKRWYGSSGKRCGAYLCVSSMYSRIGTWNTVQIFLCRLFSSTYRLCECFSIDNKNLKWQQGRESSMFYPTGTSPFGLSFLCFSEDYKIQCGLSIRNENNNYILLHLWADSPVQLYNQYFSNLTLIENSIFSLSVFKYTHQFELDRNTNYDSTNIKSANDTYI